MPSRALQLKKCVFNKGLFDCLVIKLKIQKGSTAPLSEQPRCFHEFKKKTTALLCFGKSKRSSCIRQVVTNSMGSCKSCELNPNGNRTTTNKQTTQFKKRRVLVCVLW